MAADLRPFYKGVLRTMEHILIIDRIEEDTAFLQQFKIKLLVVACNTVSAVAVDLLESSIDIPLSGVIMPGVETAIETTKNSKIGIIGTTATVTSGAYEERIKSINPDITVYGQACPMLVHLVEEGWIDEEITRLTITKYLEPLLEKSIDTIILGCTHFPVVSELIQDVVGSSITLIDSGKETAKKVKQILDKSGLNVNDKSEGNFSFYVSDIPDKFDEVGTLFLGRPVVQATHVDFDNFLMEQGEKIYEPLRRNS